MATLHWADYLVFSLFLLISLLIGIYFALTGGKQKRAKEFISGGLVNIHLYFLQHKTFPLPLCYHTSLLHIIIV